MRQRISNIQKIYSEGTRLLEKAGIAEFSLDAWYLLEQISGMTKAAYYAHPEAELTPGQEETYFENIDRRSRHIPLQHITGEQEFMGLPFFVDARVLIPRQDTEVLAEEALGQLESGMRILDLCTGSGCILLSLLVLGRKRRKLENLQGLGADISEEALMVARRNGKRLLGEDGCFTSDQLFRQSDLFERVEGTYDLIVSNPPYIPTVVIRGLAEEVRCHDPFQALDGREDGLHFYRKIIKESGKYLTRKGRLMLEIGCDQGPEVSVMMEQAGYTDVQVKKDLTGLDRVVMGRYNCP